MPFFPIIYRAVFAAFQLENLTPALEGAFGRMNLI